MGYGSEAILARLVSDRNFEVTPWLRILSCNAKTQKGSKIRTGLVSILILVAHSTSGPFSDFHSSLNASFHQTLTCFPADRIAVLTYKLREYVPMTRSRIIPIQASSFIFKYVSNNLFSSSSFADRTRVPKYQDLSDDLNSPCLRVSFHSYVALSIPQTDESICTTKNRIRLPPTNIMQPPHTSRSDTGIDASSIGFALSTAQSSVSSLKTVDEIKRPLGEETYSKWFCSMPWRPPIQIRISTSPS
ncbi:uncharacterized protein BDR25DRAFT_353313 [Lindgomyces ingoldianus]|uniref:Uncharacterized protein n=1 Tax=Lindgomyces ingoldianus TaxID=673940 RepID=A0ACB6R177_9PLEO|nr:uncharacterized protein BDR25DRAFT_353313 [Lindgomyces ingoldianus]KAF2473008.1 hypothetical protein BDR25DRAFT_353313 [Lindgomyces ingoldianus]